MKITFEYRNGAYLTLVNGIVQEAHRDLVEFLESIKDFAERYGG